MLTADDSQYMARALQLARRGLYTTTPNPRVGAVIVVEGCIVGEGWHRAAGEAHAEVIALEQAGEKSSGATCFVTLEPCNHQGRTGPCCKALIASGVKRVVFGMEDPDPRTAGSGIKALRDAGIEVDGPLMETGCRQLNAGFIMRHHQNRPLVRIKMAMSLDGRTAMPDGDAFWITGPKARADVHRWRAQSCAVISGWRTVQRDDAQLTVRPESQDRGWQDWNKRQPLRVILDSQLRLSRDIKFFTAPGEWMIANLKRDAEEAQGKEVRFGAIDQKVDIEQLLHYLAGRGCNEVLVEAGPTLAGAFVSAGLVDEIILYIAPKLMGSDSKPLFELPLTRIAEALPLHIREIRQFGQDVRVLAAAETD